MAAKKILMITGDYVEDYEVMIPFQVLGMVGHMVHVVCPDKKAGEKIRTAVHEYDGAQTFSEKRGHDFVLNKDFDAVKASDYDALVLPGGRAPEYIRTNKKVIEIVKYFANENKPIAAICHGPQILVAAEVIKGRKCSACPYLEPDITSLEGQYVDIPEDKAIVDNNLVTAPGWAAIPQWLSEFLKVLGTKITI